MPSDGTVFPPGNFLFLRFNCANSQRGRSVWVLCPLMHHSSNIHMSKLHTETSFLFQIWFNVKKLPMIKIFFSYISYPPSQLPHIVLYVFISLIVLSEHRLCLVFNSYYKKSHCENTPAGSDRILTPLTSMRCVFVVTAC